MSSQRKRKEEMRARKRQPQPKRPSFRKQRKQAELDKQRALEQKQKALEQKQKEQEQKRREMIRQQREQERQLMQRIGYTFKNPALLGQALTHPSFAHESKDNLIHNQRLEFLGDAILGLISAQELYEHCQEAEGVLSVRRAERVCEPALGSYARSIDLGQAIRLGHGEAAGGGAERDSILSDAFEALIAAIYLDGGLEAAANFVLPFLRSYAPAETQADYKTTLQEIIQQNPEEHFSYVVIRADGPDHNKRFEVELHLNSNVIGRGTGRTKKEAEQRAAHEGLKLMGYDKKR